MDVITYLKKNPKKRFSAADLKAKFGTTPTTQYLQKIRKGEFPEVHWSKARTPQGKGLRYEYFYYPELQVMEVEEALNFGYLQEVNRQFFHPLGLSLTLKGEELCLLDMRKDAVGPLFSADVVGSELFAERAERVAHESAKRLYTRQTVLGYGVQRCLNER